MKTARQRTTVIAAVCFAVSLVANVLLLRRIDQAMPVDPTVEMTLRMPLTEGRKLALIHAMGKVMRSEVDDKNMFLDAEVPESIVRRLRLADYKFAGTFPVAVS